MQLAVWLVGVKLLPKQDAGFAFRHFASYQTFLKAAVTRYAACTNDLNGADMTEQEFNELWKRASPCAPLQKR